MIVKPYSILYADPPWNFDTYSDKGKDRSAENHYPVMSIVDICSLPVKQIRADNSILFIWVNGPRLFEAELVIDSWGFTYKSIGFVWVKTTKDRLGYPIGTGYWTRQNPELCLIASADPDFDICLLATHGSPKRVDASIPTLIFEPRREHSRKPDIVRDNIVRLVGDLPRIELFARHRFDGWDAWGNEVTSDIKFIKS